MNSLSREKRALLLLLIGLVIALGVGVVRWVG